MTIVQTFEYDTTVSVDFVVVCLWAAFGLALTGLSIAVGFSAELGPVLMAAG
jgi:hypothetical protein